MHHLSASSVGFKGKLICEKMESYPQLEMQKRRLLKVGLRRNIFQMNKSFDQKRADGDAAEAPVRTLEVAPGSGAEALEVAPLQ